MVVYPHTTSCEYTQMGLHDRDPLVRHAALGVLDVDPQWLIGAAHTTGAGAGLTLAIGGCHHARCWNSGDHDRVATGTHLLTAHRCRIRRGTHATFPAAGGATSSGRIHRTGRFLLGHLVGGATVTRLTAHGNGWHLRDLYTLT